MKGARIADSSVLRTAAEHGVLDMGEFDRWMEARQWSWQALSRGEYGIDREGALLLFILTDPVRWAETFMIEPDTGGPYRFFDYQKESLRSWQQDAVHQDGAEVGKTREIITLVLWGSCTAMGFTVNNPSMLVAAPQTTHTDEIVMAVEQQMGASDGTSAKGRMLSPYWMKPKRTPHTEHRFLAPNFINPDQPTVARVHYRPAGHDGEAFRGVHVTALALMDEAAKLKSALHYTEFFRAMMPSCRSRFYSVPDGDNSSGFYRMCQEAVPALPIGQVGRRKFHWPKTLMPEPFFTAERDAKWQREYGGRTSPGYTRNVLGEHGQVSNPVWGMELLLGNVHHLPDYRAIHLVADHVQNVLNVEVRRIELNTVVEDGRAQKVPTDVHLADHGLPLDDFLRGSDDARRRAVRTLLRGFITGGKTGVWYAGADLGETNDATEIILSESIGGKLRDVLRLHAKGLPYHMQRELIYCIHELFEHHPFWGIDMGSAGTVVVKDLQTMDDYRDAHFDEQLTGFNFAEAVECIDEAGNALTAIDRKGAEVVVRAPAKHWATQCITARLQANDYALAFDVVPINQMSNHTSKQGSQHVIYSKEFDHFIDARRQQMLRLLYDKEGGVDVFAVSSHSRVAA